MSDSLSEHVQYLLHTYARQTSSVTYMLCDRHDASRVALYYENDSGEEKCYTYGDLSRWSRQFAYVLQTYGVEKGDRVSVLLPKGPELLISVLAIWRLGAIHVPLFTAFGPQAISYRIHHSGSQLVITDSINRHKLDQIHEAFMQHIQMITVTSHEDSLVRKDISFWDTLKNANAISEDINVSSDDLFILLYTSGTTGQPKGVEVPIKALAAFAGYMRLGLDVREDDMFWNMADPGWAYGLYYGLIGPMLLGQSLLMYNGKFSVKNTYRILQTYHVTNFTAAPTVYRSLRSEGVPEGFNKKMSLRVLSSAGEPLNPELSSWAKKNFGLPIHDQYGQTELGMIINNHHHPLFSNIYKLGSMGQSMPGFRAVILDSKEKELPPGKDGQLAIDIKHSPLFWFPGYYNDEKRTSEQLTLDKRYYLTGDTCRQDKDGFFYFAGRSDDMITSSGYKISPFEVESALIKHESIAEAAVVGTPDETRGEIVKAFIVLQSNVSASDALKRDISQFVKRNLSAHEYPREIEFVDELPKTSSGKTKRFQLRHDKSPMT